VKNKYILYPTMLYAFKNIYILGVIVVVFKDGLRVRNKKKYKTIHKTIFKLSAFFNDFFYFME